MFGFCFFDTSNLDHRLHLAAWSGQAEVVSYLCKHKADVGAAAMDDMGAIHFAAQKGHLEVIRTLLSSGASINAFTRKGLTPLHYAVQGSHLELVKYLVKKGASLSAKTKAGKTPVDLANNEEILSFLEEYERSSKKRDLHGRQKAGESDSKPSMQEKEENTGDKAPSVVNDELENEKVEMKDDEDNRKEASSEPKKARIALNHLLTADDDLEDEENLWGYTTIVVEWLYNNIMNFALYNIMNCFIVLLSVIGFSS